MAKVFCYADGLCEPNPGYGTWAWVLFNEQGERLNCQFGEVGDGTTNNVAEYYGAGHALKYLVQNHLQDEIHFYSDSQLVLNQLDGQWNCNKENLRRLRDRCCVHLAQLKISLHWVASAENKADEFTRQAYKDKWGHLPPIRSHRAKDKKSEWDRKTAVRVK